MRLHRSGKELGLSCQGEKKSTLRNMLSSAVLSYRLVLTQGRKKNWFESTNGSISPRPWSTDKLIIYLQTYSHSLLHSLPHVHMPTRYRDGYISSHACTCSLICVRAGCCGDVVTGGEGDGGRHPETQRGESAWVRSFTPEGEERSVPS